MSASSSLDRSIGFGKALAIGVGTMFGAGIFVFPGLAVGGAGPAAALSFALGGSIALLVAMCAAELVTAMPRTGGGYFFVSRALGARIGSLAGLGQWVGLVFAAAFYLVGCSSYLLDLLRQSGIELAWSPGVVACALGVVLTTWAIVGTRESTRLQLVIVGVLCAVLGVFLALGVVRVAGDGGGALAREPFAPHGALPIFTTAALVFTSYLGFAQIANVAGEVTRPSRNLPRALLGSVLIVTLVYVATVLTGVALLGTREMGDAGKTAMSNVGTELFGPSGGLVIASAGLLATLSSANATILSSSRALFALSRDAVVPGYWAQVGERFGTPHRALMLTGVPSALLALLGSMEVLAEAASILHLLLYGLICASVPVFRRTGFPWYRPTFRSIGSPWLPGLGAFFCAGLVAFMAWPSLAAAGVVVLASLAWQLVRKEEPQIGGADDLAPAANLSSAEVLLSVALDLDAEGVIRPREEPDARALAAMLAALDPRSAALVGWVEAPGSSTPRPTRERVESRALDALAPLHDRIAASCQQVETEITFGGDRVDATREALSECQADVVAWLACSIECPGVLLATRCTAQADRAIGYAARLARALDVELELLPIDGGDEDPGACSSRLVEFGMQRDQVRISDEPLAADRSETGILEALHSGGAGRILVLGSVPSHGRDAEPDGHGFLASRWLADLEHSCILVPPDPTNGNE